MKKICCITALIFSIFCISGCHSGVSEIPYADLGYINYPGVQWNMSREAFFQSAGDTAEDYTFEEEHKENISACKYAGKHMSFLDQPAVMSVNFSSNLFEEEQTLRSISFVFENAIAQDEFETICRQLMEIAEKQKAITSDPATSQKGDNIVLWTLSSAAANSDLPESDKEKINKLYHYTSEKLGQPVPESVNYFDVFGGAPLSFISANYMIKEQKLYVTFSGQTIANELEHIKTFHKIFDESYNQY